MLADRVGLDREVEVDTDLLEEVVADGDEPDLDRDLKVLEPAELAEQVGDLLVDLGRVADDQADAEEERDDRAGRPLLLVDPAAAAAAESAAQARRPTETSWPELSVTRQVPGAIDVVMSWISGVMSTCGRSPLVVPSPLDGEAVGVCAAASSACRLHAARALVEVGRAGRSLHGRRLGRVRRLAGGHDQVADVVRLGERLRRARPAGW